MPPCWTDTLEVTRTACRTLFFCFSRKRVGEGSVLCCPSSETNRHTTSPSLRQFQIVGRAPVRRRGVRQTHGELFRSESEWSTGDDDPVTIVSENINGRLTDGRLTSTATPVDHFKSDRKSPSGGRDVAHETKFCPEGRVAENNSRVPRDRDFFVSLHSKYLITFLRVVP